MLNSFVITPMAFLGHFLSGRGLSGMVPMAHSDYASHAGLPRGACCCGREAMASRTTVLSGSPCGVVRLGSNPDDTPDERLTKGGPIRRKVIRGKDDEQQ
jgi:hypothetical protein